MPADVQPSVPVGISSAWTSDAEPTAAAEGASQVQPFLRTRIADGLSLFLFSSSAAYASELFGFMTAHTLIALSIGVSLLGPLGCAIEWGVARRAGWRGALAVGATAALLHLASLWLLRGEPTDLLVRGLPIALLGTLLARFAYRFDRGEEGWRAAVRAGPPLGFSPLAERIAAFRLPTALRWLLLPILPVTLVLRLACMAAILIYQLTLSRLMPSACRYEPTCSRYGFHAYMHHGSLIGSLLTALRLGRCSPIGSGGFDPVPRAGPLLPWSKP